MIAEALLNIVFGFVQYVLIPLFPKGFQLPAWGVSAIALIQKGLLFFPIDVFQILFGYFTFKTTIFMTWSVIEWLYKKIPGVD